MSSSSALATRPVTMAARSLRASRQCAVQPASPRYASGIARSKLVREMDRASKLNSTKATKEQTMSEMQKLAHIEYFKQGGGPLFPGTFVALPLALGPKSLGEFAQYQFNRSRAWLTGVMTVLQYKLKSMPNWTTRPKWKARRGKIAPTAKAMYREVLEAFAAGDKKTIERLCVPDFAKKLINAIERRSNKETVSFELVKYTKPMFYPRLMSHQIHQINPMDKTTATEQAVVAISSQQQASRHNATTGEIVPGSLRIQDKIEYVVLSRATSETTFTAEPWRVWGTTVGTTLETHLMEKDAVEKEQIQRAGWNKD